MDERGKVRLSRKAVDQATGEAIEHKGRGDQPRQGAAE
jgi:polyribonucleotide nucleotidyltransferase